MRSFSEKSAFRLPKLEASALIRLVDPPGRTTLEAERRQVTVLFTDMVGFTAFSEASGEEAAFRLMQDVAKLTGDVVREQGGAVQELHRRRTDGGFRRPVAYEDAPLKACGPRSALSIASRGRRTICSQIRRSPAIANRGQHRDGGGRRGAGNGGVTVMGDAVNIAARLQTVAIPGTICLTEATRSSRGPDRG